MSDRSNRGGARPDSGPTHTHIEYVSVEVVDFYGNKDHILIGPYLTRSGEVSQKTLNRARSVGRHHVTERARLVLIVSRKCCAPAAESVVLEPVTEGVKESDYIHDEEMRRAVAYFQGVES